MSVEREFGGVDETGERLLEYLFDTQCAMPPAVLAWNLSERGAEVSRRAVARRLRRLERVGLVERACEERGYYRIDDDGVAYLASTLDEAALRASE